MDTENRDVLFALGFAGLMAAGIFGVVRLIAREEEREQQVGSKAFWIEFEKAVQAHTLRDPAVEAFKEAYRREISQFHDSAKILRFKDLVELKLKTIYA